MEEPEAAMPVAADPGRDGDPMPDPSVDVVCRQVVELVTDYLEGALPADLRAAVERHLQLCPPCVTYVEQMRLTAASLREIPVESISPGVRRDLVSAFRELVPGADTRPGVDPPGDSPA